MSPRDGRSSTAGAPPRFARASHPVSAAHRGSETVLRHATTARRAAETGWDARPKPLRGMSQGRQEPSIWRALADAGLKPTENAVLDRLFEAFALDARGANV